MNCAIREMTKSDWPQVASIYQQGIATKHATFVREVPAYEVWDTWYLPQCRLVAETAEGKLVGWIALSPVNKKGTYAGVAEISIYVAADSRGMKVGTKLIQAVITASEAAGIWMLQAVVFASNKASIRLHEKCGFRQVGRRERINQDVDGVWQDTLLLERRSKVVGC